MLQKVRWAFSSGYINHIFSSGHFDSIFFNVLPTDCMMACINAYAWQRHKNHDKCVVFTRVALVQALVWLFSGALVQALVWLQFKLQCDSLVCLQRHINNDKCVVFTRVALVQALVWLLVWLQVKLQCSVALRQALVWLFSVALVQTLV